MLIRLRESYPVAQDNVVLSVVVGDGQKSYSEVLLDGRRLASGAELPTIDLGPGAALAGRRLRITSTVADTNPDTNHTSITYSLSGGVSDRTFALEHTVDLPGDTVDYDAIFRLL
jgi:hypothetical protein